MTPNTSSWKLNFLGTGGPASQSFRSQPAALLEIAGKNYLFDAGDGTADRLRLIGKTSLDLIAISEVSVSAMAGLLAVAELSRKHGRPPTRVIGPAGLTEALLALATLSRSSVEELFSVEQLVYGSPSELQSGLFLEPVEVDVGPLSSANAYLLYESAISGRVNAALGKELGLTGRDYTALQNGETVRGVKPSDVIGPPQVGRRLVIAARGRGTRALLDALEGSDVAVLAAPFMDERLQVAEESGFLVGWEAAQMFAESRVNFGLVTQLGGYAPTWVQLAEARQYFPATHAPGDRQVVEIPLPGRGSPSFAKAERRGS